MAAACAGRFGDGASPLCSYVYASKRWRRRLRDLCNALVRGSGRGAIVIAKITPSRKCVFVVFVHTSVSRRAENDYGGLTFL